MAKKKDDTTAGAVVKKEKKKHPGLRLIIFLLELLLIAGGIVGSILFIRKYNDPKLTATGYADALLAGDYETAYGYLVKDEENAFLTLEAYAAAMEATGVAKADKSELVKNEDGSFKLVYDNKEIMIRLIEQDEKRYYVFRDYQIEHQNLYVEDIKFVAAKDLQISLNGIVLDSHSCRIDEVEGLDLYQTSYTIDKMYAGPYIMEVTGENFKPYTEALAITSDAMYTEVAMPYISDELVEILTMQAYQDLQEIFQSAMNQEEQCQLIEDAKMNGVFASSYDDNVYYYNSLKEHFNIEDGFFEYLELKDWSASIQGYFYDDVTGKFLVDISLEYTEDYGYRMLDWWTESYYEKYDSSADGLAAFYYGYVDGEWVLADLFLYDPIYIW